MTGIYTRDYWKDQIGLINENLFYHLSEYTLKAGQPLIPSACARIATCTIDPLVDFFQPKSPLVSRTIKVLLGAGITYGISRYYGSKGDRWIREFAVLAIEHQLIPYLVSACSIAVVEPEEDDDLKAMYGKLCAMGRALNKMKLLQAVVYMAPLAGRYYRGNLYPNVTQVFSWLPAEATGQAMFDFQNLITSIVLNAGRLFIMDKKIKTNSDKVIRYSLIGASSCLGVCVAQIAAREIFGQTVLTKWNYPKAFIATVFIAPSFNRYIAPLLTKMKEQEEKIKVLEENIRNREEG